jgi:hypothetical protein
MGSVGSVGSVGETGSKLPLISPKALKPKA